MNNKEKRETVKKDYDIIANQYAADFGTYIEDLNVYEEFEKQLNKNATILDLGAGSGRTYAYFNNKGYNYIALDFSEKMKEEAYKIHGEFPYIVDDMVNLKSHFKSNSVDAVFAVYSLFHLPADDLENVFKSIYDILKDDGLFLFSYQVGNGEEMSDEPYLEEKGKNVLYMSYYSEQMIDNLLKRYSFLKKYEFQKIEDSDKAINSEDKITKFVLAKKI